MNKIFDLNSSFQEFHKKRNKFLKKLAGNAKFHLENVQKKNEQIEFHEKKRRIEALKKK